jgi:hypothetical protein
MRKLIPLLAVVLVISSAVAFGGTKKKHGGKTWDGYIAKASSGTMVIEITNPNGTNSHVVTYFDNSIKITLNGKPANLRDLRLRMHVVVKMRNKIVADSIAADTGGGGNSSK